MAKRWIWALVAVTLLGGALRAGPALRPEPVSLGRRAGLRQRRARSGRDRPLRPRQPPLAAGAPVAFAAAASSPATRASDIPAAVRDPVVRRHRADPARLPAHAPPGGDPAGGARRRRDRRDLPAADRRHRRPAVGAARRALADGRVRGAQPSGAAPACCSPRRSSPARTCSILLPVLAVWRSGRVAARSSRSRRWSRSGPGRSTRTRWSRRGGGSSLFVGTFLPGDGTLRRHEGRAERLRDAARDPARCWTRSPPAARTSTASAALRAEGWDNVRTYTREDPLGYAGMSLASCRGCG